MSLAANLLAGSLIGAVQLSESEGREFVDDECLILSMEKLTSSSPSGFEEKSKESESSYNANSQYSVLQEDSSKHSKPTDYKSQSTGGKNETNIRKTSKSRLPIQQGQEFPEVHHGIAASSMPIPLSQIFKNWKDVPKIHQYPAAQLKVVFHRQSGEIKTKTPGASIVKNHTHEVDKADKEIKDMFSPNDPMIAVRNDQSSIPDVIGIAHELKNSTNEKNNTSLVYQNVVSPEAYLASFKTQHCQTDDQAMSLTSGKAVQTDRETIQNQKLNDLSQLCSSFENQSSFKDQDSQTNVSMTTPMIVEASQTDRENLTIFTSTASGTDAELDTIGEFGLQDSLSSCRSCHTLQDQMQGFEENVKRLVKMLDDTTEDLNEQERRVQNLIQENIKINSIKTSQESDLKRLNLSMESSSSKLKASLMQNEVLVKQNKQLASKVVELEDTIQRLEQTLCVDNENNARCLLLNQELHALNSQLEDSKTKLEIRLKTSEELEEKQENKLLNYEKKLQEAEAENSQLKIKMQHQQVQIASFQCGMSRLRSAIDRPVMNTNLEEIPDGRVEDILMRAENVIVNHPNSENRLGNINNYLAEIRESVSIINGRAPPNGFNNQDLSPLINTKFNP